MRPTMFNIATAALIPLLAAAPYLAAAAPPGEPARPRAVPTTAHAATRPAKFESFTQTLPGLLVKFDMVAVPAGKLVTAIGAPDDKPREVAVKAFYLGMHEVTWDEYDVFTYCLDIPEKDRPGQWSDQMEALLRPSLPYRNMDGGYGHEGWPAGSVHPQGATKYCRWLSAKTGRKYRLPTEAEWEYAARFGAAGDGRVDRAILDAIAWHRGNAEEAPHAVGKRRPNALGLHDLFGNVQEWTLAANGAWVTRGGSYVDPAAQVNLESRHVFDKALSRMWQASQGNLVKSIWWLSDGPHVGFRVVCEE